MRTYITAFMLVVTLGLVSCGGGNDVASSGASAVSAAAPASKPDISSASSPLTTPATPTTKPKINGQIDERTGVAPVGAAMTMSTATAACVGSPVASCWTITSASVCKSSYNADVGYQCGYTTYCFNDGASPCNSSVYVPVASSGSNVGQCLLRSFPACTQNMFGYPSSTAMWYAVEMGVTSTTCVWENALYCNSDTCPTTSCGGGGVVRGK